jgi:molybdate transport system substrate-binding protein
MKFSSIAAGTGLALAAALFAGAAGAAEIKVMASTAIKEAYLQLVPEFERASENKVVTEWVPTVQLVQRIKDGEAVDLIMMSSSNVDDLMGLGKLVAGSRVDVAKSGVGIAVRAGAPKPDISSADALKRALLQAKSIAYSTGPSGVYLAVLFQRMGIADEIKDKVKQVQGIPVGDVVARGDAEIGFQQVSELLPVKGIDYIGPLPPDMQQTTVFAAALPPGAKNPDAAKALIRFLTAPEAAAVIRKTGMEPG